MKTNFTKTIVMASVITFGLLTAAKAQSAYNDDQYAYSQPNNNGYNQYQSSPNDQQSFYYYPDANVYYDISCNRYIYNNGYGWINVNILPNSICLNNAPRYTVYHRGPQVWLDNASHYRNYYRPAYRQPQIQIGFNYRHNDFGRRDIVRRDDDRRGNFERGRDSDHGHDNNRGGHRW